MLFDRGLLPATSVDMDEPLDEDPFDDLPVDQRSCKLLGPTALAVQAVMGVFIILSLVYKRQREKPMRPWRIWLFDVSKQVIGQMFVHGVNVLISDVGAHRISGNACVYYFLNILIDTTLGVAIIYLILYLTTELLSVRLHLNGFESGQYGSPPSINYWARQAAVYVLTITTMKLLVVALFALWPGIFHIGSWLLSWLGPRDAVQIIFVMGVFPIFMNILQFWLIDSIVKGRGNFVNLVDDSPHTPANEDEEPLFRASSDDEDEDDNGSRLGHDVENPQLSSSRSPSRDPNNPKAQPSPITDEHKSVGSGSVTPGTTEVLSDSVAMHPYPPSLGSTSSSSSRPTSTSPPPSHRYKRPPPPPLLPRSPLQPALNSPQPASTLLKPRHSRDKENALHKEWEAWDDSEDWADRIGEEDWTGNRMELRKGVLNNVWTAASPVVQAR